MNKHIFKGMFTYTEPRNKLDRKIRRAFPGYESEKEEDRLERLERLKAHGKGPPKKGFGRRKTKK